LTGRYLKPWVGVVSRLVYWTTDQAVQV